MKFCIYQSIGCKTLVKEERVPYVFQLSNEGLFSYTRIRVNFMKDYSSVENMDQTTDYYLLPTDKINKETRLCCHYRGEYTVGIDFVTVRDYLNLFQFTYACDSAIHVKVLPRVLHISNLAIAPKIEDVKKQDYYIQTKQEIPDVEVRDYQPSDSLRKIHWKSTAKHGKLLTRKFTDEPKTQLVVFLDLKKLTDKNRIIIEDKMIESVLAIVDYYVRNLFPVTVLLNTSGVKQIQVCNRDDFEQLYAVCSSVYFQSQVGGEILLTNALQQNTSHQHGMLLTATIDEDLSRAAYQYTEMGNELSIIVYGDFDMNEKIHTMTSRVHMYQINNNDEVQDVLERKIV